LTEKRVIVLPDLENRCPYLVFAVPRSEKWRGKRATGCATARFASHPVPRSVPRKFREKTSQTLVLLGSSTVPRFSEERYTEKITPGFSHDAGIKTEVSD
jgi:hypothetical protein